MPKEVFTKLTDFLCVSEQRDRRGGQASRAWIIEDPDKKVVQDLLGGWVKGRLEATKSVCRERFRPVGGGLREGERTPILKGMKVDSLR